MDAPVNRLMRDNSGQFVSPGFSAVQTGNNPFADGTGPMTEEFRAAGMATAEKVFGEIPGYPKGSPI